MSTAQHLPYLVCAIARIHPMVAQPREVFDELALTELAQSMREHGVVEPLVVRRAGDDFELIAGERRLRAAERAGLTEVPVVVREATDREALELALVENIQRENLNEIELAKALRRLQDEHGYTQESLADRLGKDRSTIANTLALLRLPNETQVLIAERAITSGHGRALLRLSDNPEALRSLQDRIVAGRLTVRTTEMLARRASDGTGHQTEYTLAVEEVTEMAKEAAAAGVDLYQALERVERTEAWKGDGHHDFGEFLAKRWPNSIGVHRYKSVTEAIRVYGVRMIRAVGPEAAHCLLEPAIVDNEKKLISVISDLNHHLTKYGAAPQVAEIRRLVKHHAGETQTSNVADRAAAARERDTEIAKLRREAVEAQRTIGRLTRDLEKAKAENTELRRRNTDLSKQLSQRKRA